MSAPTPPHDPAPLDVAVTAFREMPVLPRPADDELIARMAAGALPEAEVPSRSRRRMLMRVTTWSAAAAVLIAAAGMIFLNGSASVALADVVKAAEKHRLVKFNITETFERDDGLEPKIGTSTYVGYADLTSPRYRRETPKVLTLNGTVEFSTYTVQDGMKDRFLQVVTQTIVEGVDKDPDKERILNDAKDLKLPLKQALLRPMPTAAGVNNKLTFLDNLRALESHEDAVSTKEDVDGRGAVKYVIEDGNRATTLWVDAQTKLPVRMKVELIGNGKLTLDHTSFEWDPNRKDAKSPDELFDTTPPAGYELTDETKGN